MASLSGVSMIKSSFLAFLILYHAASFLIFRRKLLDEFRHFNVQTSDFRGHI